MHCKIEQSGHKRSIKFFIHYLLYIDFSPKFLLNLWSIAHSFGKNYGSIDAKKCFLNIIINSSILSSVSNFLATSSPWVFFKSFFNYSFNLAISYLLNYSGNSTMCFNFSLASKYSLWSNSFPALPMLSHFFNKYVNLSTTYFSYPKLSSGTS